MDLIDMIRRCRAGEPAAREHLFTHYRQYLAILARAQLGRHLRGKCDSSDLVQQTLLEAFQSLAQFHGETEAELLAWLRRILAHNLFNEARRYATQQRNAAREISLEQMQNGVDQSSLRLGCCLAADQPSPSDIVQQRERGIQLANALAQLPEDYQMVLSLRLFEERSAEEVAQQMGRSAGAVRMLQLRALAALREQLNQDSSRP